MSFTALGWAVSVKTGSPVDKAVLIQLASLADENESCFPSHAWLAEQTEYGVTAVKDALKRLQTAGLVEVHARTPARGQTSNRYVLVRVPKADKLASRETTGGRSGDDYYSVKNTNQEPTTSSRPAPRGVSQAVVEIAREAEAGVIRKGAAAERERSVDRGPVTSGWPKRKTPRKEPTPAMRCFGIAERFRAQALAAFPDEAMQASTDGVYKTLRRILKDSPGLTWEHLDRASELFWLDTARLHRPGVPAWKNFLHHIPQLAETARVELTPALSPEEWFAGRDDSGPMSDEEISKWAQGL